MSDDRARICQALDPKKPHYFHASFKTVEESASYHRLYDEELERYRQSVGENCSRFLVRFELARDIMKSTET